MIKLRSYNEKDKCFYFFVDGGYFNCKGEVEDWWKFNWKNADRLVVSLPYGEESFEIYENDIYKDSYDKYQKVSFQIIDRREVVGHGQTERIVDASFRLNYAPDTIEIFGNTHQTPELMRK